MWDMIRGSGSRPPLQAAVSVALALWCAACQAEVEAPAPVRPARVMVVEPPAEAADVSFAGHIEPQDQASLSFRVGGRLVERPARVGATLREGEVVARLDPENELNELRSAQDFALRVRDYKSGFCIADHWGHAIGVPHGPPRFLGNCEPGTPTETTVRTCLRERCEARLTSPLRLRRRQSGRAHAGTRPG